MKESPKRCGWFAAIQVSSAESTTVKLRPLCSTRWILRKDCIDAFLENYNNLNNFMEEINNDTNVSAAARSSAFSHLLNLEKFDFYFILRLLQRLFGIIHPIHVKCQSRQATTGDLNDWIQELASTPTTNLDTFGKELFAECKEQALHMKINLPVIPRVCRAFTDEKVEEYYVDLFTQVFEKSPSITATRNSKLFTLSFGR